MEDDQVQMLSGPQNYAVVQLPGRRFPGVVVQGDSLHSLVVLLGALQAMVVKYDDQELSDGVSDLHEVLGGALEHYEATCARHGISLPY